MFALGLQARELLFLGQVLQRDVARGGLPFCFQFGELRVPGGEGFVQAGFLLLPGFQFGRFVDGGEAQRAEGGAVAVALGLCAADLAAELALGGVDHGGGRRKRLGAVLD